MNLFLLITILIGAIQIIAVVPYIKDMVRGTTRPNMVSWVLWDIALFIALVAKISEGIDWSIVIIVSAIFVDSIVLLFALGGYGYKKFGVIDGVCLFLSLCALGLWVATSEPLFALFLAIAADATAYIPTIAKAYRDSQSETALTWLLAASAGFLSIFLAIPFTVMAIAFPFYYMCINLIVWYGIVRYRLHLLS